MFQKAVDDCEHSIVSAAQTQAAAEAKGLLADAKKLLAEGKAELDGARRITLAKKLVADSQIEKTNGNLKGANTLKEKAKLRLQEIIWKYPKTKAATEAEELLDKL